MRSWLALLLPALAVLGLMFWSAARQSSPQELRVIEKPLNCTQPLTFELLDQDRPTAIQRRPNNGIAFRLNATVLGEFCRPGTLTITAEGEVAGGEAPILMATFNSSEIYRSPISARQTIKLRLAEPGQMTLAYLNDFNEVKARTAALRLVSADGAPCATIQTEGKERRPWSPSSNSISVATGTPLNITPCRAGSLTFTVSGKAAAGAFPRVQFVQQGQVVQEMTTRLQPTSVQVRVAAVPLEIKIANPYYAKNSDRNLDIVRMDFRPDQD